LLFFRLTSRTKLFWANLLFILMVGGIGAQALSSQGVNATPDRYDNFVSGTSVAAPHVAGAAALIKSRHPNASPAEIEKILHNDATKVPPASLKAPVDPRQSCDGKARGYFAHAYPPSSKVRPGSGYHYEDLLFMGNIK
jgi:subtilisin family serine protease